MMYVFKIIKINNEKNEMEIEDEEFELVSEKDQNEIDIVDDDLMSVKSESSGGSRIIKLNFDYSDLTENETSLIKLKLNIKDVLHFSEVDNKNELKKGK